jgi:hypothetical protein
VEKKAVVICEKRNHLLSKERLNKPPAFYSFSFSGSVFLEYGQCCSRATEEQLAKLAAVPAAVCTVTGIQLRTPLKAAAWARLLALTAYPCAQSAAMLVSAIQLGVQVGYTGPRTGIVIAPNLLSARQNVAAVQKNIDAELANGRRCGPYDISPFPYFRANPVGVVFKKGKAKPRLIHHLSWPREGDSVNKSVTQFEVSLPAFDKAVQLLTRMGAELPEHLRGKVPACYMSKVDIDAAYRCIPVRPADWPLLGLHWQDKLYFDLVMQFGLASATAVFEWYSSAAEWIAKGSLAIRDLIHYVDDFLHFVKNEQEAKRQLAALLFLFAQLGLPVSQSKIEGPSALMIFLGILFDAIKLTISLAPDRVADIEALLAEWREKISASRAELQSLIGVLSFASNVVVSSRIFLRRMIQQQQLIPSGAFATTKFPLSSTFFADLKWWTAFIRSANGKALAHSCVNLPVVHAYTDACRVGYGTVTNNEWYSCSWTDAEETTARRLKRDSMPWKELYAIAKTLATFAESWRGHKVVLHSDCEPAIKAWRKGDSRKPEMATLLRTILFICATHDIEVQVDFIAGVDNVLADALSRLQVHKFKELHPQHSRLPVMCLPLPIHDW